MAWSTRSGRDGSPGHRQRYREDVPPSRDGERRDHHGESPLGLRYLPGRIRGRGRRAQVLTEVIRTIDRNVEALNITGYTHFSLRDQDSHSTSLFHRFGLMTDDYTPKPALTPTATSSTSTRHRRPQELADAARCRAGHCRKYCLTASATSRGPFWSG